jgi:hypothetical protein
MNIARPGKFTISTSGASGTGDDLAIGGSVAYRPEVRHAACPLTERLRPRSIRETYETTSLNGHYR